METGANLVAQQLWQVIELAIGHLQSDNRMNRCWLHGATGDTLRAVLCAAGYNLRWLLREMVRLGLTALLLCSGLLTRLISILRSHLFGNLNMSRYAFSRIALGVGN